MNSVGNASGFWKIMTDSINSNISFDFISKTMGKQQTARGVSEWHQVFDKMMMNVFTKTEELNRETDNPLCNKLNYQNEFSQNLNQHQTSLPVMEESTSHFMGQTSNALMKNVVPSAIRNFELNDNSINLINPIYTKVMCLSTCVTDEDAIHSIQYLWDLLRNRLSKTQHDRLHITLAGKNLKIYVRHNSECQDSTYNLIRNILKNITHIDYAVSEIKINGKIIYHLNKGE